MVKPAELCYADNTIIVEETEGTVQKEHTLGKWAIINVKYANIKVYSTKT